MLYISSYPGFYPLVVACLSCAASRGTAGAVGLGAKGIGKIADYIGNDEMSASLNKTAKRFIAYATREGHSEEQIIQALISLGIITQLTTSTIKSEINSINHLPDPLGQNYTYNNESYTNTPESPYTIPATYLEQLIPTINRIMQNVSENPYLIKDAPLMATVTTSFIYRMTTGFLGGCAKATSNALNLLGLNDYSKPADDTGNALIDLAKKTPRLEARLIEGALCHKFIYFIGQGTGYIRG